jgi:protein gp37
LGWSTARVIFVNSMSDVFHADIPEEFTRRIFEVMLDADWHTYQVLTKRPARAHRFLRRNRDLLRDGILPPHIWLGTSVEDQEAAFRVGQLRDAPAAVRFLSCEPLIGPVGLDLDGIHWVIVGGESGPVRRPMKPEWAAAIRDRCAEAGVPFFFKQWDGRTPKAGGRELDGRLWDEMPLQAAGS